MVQPDNYVFPAEVRSQLSVAVALRLETYLRQGDESRELIGLDTAPQFLIRDGTGVPGDEKIYETCDILYPDDAAEGKPFVRVVSVEPVSSPTDWGDDQEYSQWRVALDCNASEFNGAVTEGANPANADAQLSDAAWNLVSNFDAMCAAGFVDANAVPGAGDIAGVDFHIPVTLTFEIYVFKE